MMPEVPNAGVVGAHYERCELTQGLSYQQSTFANQRLEFRWNAGAANYWYVPARSYLRTRFRLGFRRTTLTNLHANSGDAAEVKADKAVVLAQSGSADSAETAGADHLNARWLALNDMSEGGFIQRFSASPLAMLIYARVAAAEKALFLNRAMEQAEREALFPTNANMGVPTASATGTRFTGVDCKGAQNPDERGFDITSKVTVAFVTNLLKELNRCVELLAEGNLPLTYIEAGEIKSGGTTLAFEHEKNSPDRIRVPYRRNLWPGPNAPCDARASISRRPPQPVHVPQDQDRGSYLPRPRVHVALVQRGFSDLRRPSRFGH